MKLDPNQKQKDTINITDDPAATDNPSAWKEPTGTDDGAGFDLTTAGTTSIKTYNVFSSSKLSTFNTTPSIGNSKELLFFPKSSIKLSISLALCAKPFSL